MKIDIQQFAGMIPKASPRLLPNNAAQEAVNCQFSSGALKPWGDLDEVTVPHSDTVIRSLYRYGNEWLTWETDVDIVPTQLASDPYNRIYYTGDGVPKVRDKDANVYPLGIPAPLHATDSSKTPVAVTVSGEASKTAAIDRISIDDNGVVTVVSIDHNLSLDLEFPVKLSGTGIPILNNFERFPKVVDENSFTLEGVSVLLEGSIKKISRTNPVVVNSAHHGLIDGDTVHLAVNGMAELQNWTGVIRWKDGNNFILEGVDGREFTPFTSGTFRLMSRDFHGRAPIALSAMTKGATTAFTTKEYHGLRTGDTAMLIMAGVPGLNGWSGAITVTGRDTFTIGYDSTAAATFTSGSVQLMSRDYSLPAPRAIEKVAHNKIYCDDHGLIDGDTVFLTNVIGYAELNGHQGAVVVASSGAFSLSGVTLDPSKTFISGEFIKLLKFGGGAPDPLAITSIAKAAIAKVSFGTAKHNFISGDIVQFSGEIGITELVDWAGPVIVTSDTEIVLDGIDSTSFTGTFTTGGVYLKTRSYAAEKPVRIKAITYANPAEVETEKKHSLQTGDWVTLSVVGTDQLDGWTGLVTVVDETHFTLDDVDSTTYGAFVSGTYTRIAQWDARLDETKEETYSYTFTYVSKYGEEGPPAIPSDSVDLLPGMLPIITLIDPPNGYPNIATKRLYRTNPGTTDTAWQHVEDVPVGTGTYSDTKKANQLGIELASQEWDGPPADLKGIIALPNGILAGFRGNEICFCEPWQPHAWPLSYRLSTSWPIVAIGAFGTSILVTTERSPYLVTGAEPGGMTMERMEIGEACLSKRGLVDLGYCCIYPSSAGLVLAGIGQMDLVTKNVIGRGEWAKYNPSSFTAFAYDGAYFAFYEKDDGERGGIVFDPQSQTFVELDFWCSAGYSDQSTGDLFLVEDDRICKWDSAEGRPYRWRSKVFVLPKPMNFGVGRVTADDYPVQIALYGNGECFFSEVITDDYLFRLPSGHRYTSLEIELQGNASVDRIQIAEGIEDLQE